MSETDIPVTIAPSWLPLLEQEFHEQYFKELRTKVREAYLEKKVFPHPTRMFRALELCSPEDIKVVILGQDPYHTPGVADGLAFSSFPENPVPPSLQNIFKEIQEEFGVPLCTNPDLSGWAKQGVLLLNASLSVESGLANSHVGFGWHAFTDALISALSRDKEHIVFLLWGNYAREKKGLINTTKHCVLESPHPSPLSAHRGFLGNGHFKKANVYLLEKGRGSIDWPRSSTC